MRELHSVNCIEPITGNKTSFLEKLVTAWFLNVEYGERLDDEERSSKRLVQVVVEQKPKSENSKKMWSVGLLIFRWPGVLPELHLQST